MSRASAIHDLPQFIRDLLASPPRHGDGVHAWLFKMARQLHAHRSEPGICELLAAAVSDCGRLVTTQEIQNAVRDAEASAWRGTGQAMRTGTPTQPRWPCVNAEQREAVLREMDGFGLVDLWETSPCRWDDREAHTNEIIETIYPGDCLLCAGGTNGGAITKPLAEWLADDMSRLQFLVPSPMSKLTGSNKEGRESARCNDNTAVRRFLVIECDHGTIDEQAAILTWLARRAPLTTAVHSGGKSLHGWFYCGGADDQKLNGFFHLACSLGADSAMWTPCQMTRMPDGSRAVDQANKRGAARQAVYFFNPETCR